MQEEEHNGMNAGELMQESLGYDTDEVIAMSGDEEENYELNPFDAA